MAAFPYSIMDKVKVKIAFLARVIEADATGTIVDTLGFDSVGLVLVLHTTTTADAENTLEIVWQEGDNVSLNDAGTIAATDMVAVQGTLTNPIVAVDTDVTVYTWKYIGDKRYLRCNVDITGTVVGLYSAYVLLGNPRVVPVS